EERDALLDAVVARLLPEEGRVWVAHVPVSRDTVRRIRGMVAEVDLRSRPVEHRSLLWNVLVAGKSGQRTLNGLVRRPRKAERLAARRALERVGLGGRELETAASLGAVDRARLALASALVSTPDVLAVREIDRGFDGAEAQSLRAVLQSLARRERLAVPARATPPPPAAGFSDPLLPTPRRPPGFPGSPPRLAGRRAAPPL